MGRARKGAGSLLGLGGKVRIEWGDTPEERGAVMRRLMQQVCEDLYDNGQPGLISRVEDFMTTHRALDEERKQQHKANTDRLNIIIGLLIAIAAYIAIVVSVSHPFKSKLDPERVFHSEAPAMASAQSAHIPFL
jgi:hypothetical protein